MAERTRLMRWLYAGAGLACVGLAVVGVFVPVLPTTPFLLLAAACFLRSSQRLYDWLLGQRWLGAYIRNYREHRAVSRGAKIMTLTLLWASIGYATIWVVEHWALRAGLMVIAIGVTVHILSLRTLSREEGDEPSFGALTSEADEHEPTTE